MRNRLAVLKLYVFCMVVGITYSVCAGEKVVQKTPVEKVNNGGLWWEAENAVTNTFPESNSFKPYSKQEKDVLSGGAWLQTDKGSGGTASWVIDVPEDGKYTLWVRKFWQHGPFKWRFNDQEYQFCTRKLHLADSEYIRTHVCANWVKLGQVDLNKGVNKLEIIADKDATAFAIDCWLLTQKEFTPRGAKRPGEKYNRSDEGWFAFEPDDDPFTDDTCFDLRNLNQAFAGADGWVAADGPDFVFSKTKQKVKFWAVNVVVQGEHKMMDRLAKKLAKRGVNMVRIHAPIWDAESSDPTAINRDHLDRVQYFVHAMAKQGIYTKLSFYFPLWAQIKPEWKLTGYSADDLKKNKVIHPYGLLFFEPNMQKLYKTWITSFLTAPNPYTKKPLLKDPALAIIEVMNEDGLFFWTFSPYKNPLPETMVILEKQFGSWLIKKYGDIATAQKKWGKERNPKHPDYPEQGRAAFYENAGFMGGFDWAVQQRNELRVRDQVQFLVELQYSFYKSTKDFYKNELKYEGLISASNWSTVDNRVLGALEKYTYTACDVIDRHGYYSAMHKGEGRSFSVRKGHTFSNKSGIVNAESLTNEVQYGNMPHMISEYNYPMPNRFRAEGPFMAATYGSLSGTDAFFHFRIHTNRWSTSNGKFPIHTPVMLGQFPACAYVYRKGLVKEGADVVDMTLSLKDLFALKGTPVAQPQHFDELRKQDIPEGGVLTSDAPQAIDPLAFYIGQVKLNFSKDNNLSKISDLSKYIDRKQKKVVSSTGELQWKWGDNGIVTVDAPKVKAACGFLQKNGKIEIGGFSIVSNNEYANIMLVSLDDKPIDQSAKMLLQVMTEDQNYNWKTTEGDVKTILNTGAAPLEVKEISGTVELKSANASGMVALALDVNGYKKKKVSTGAEGKIKVDLEKDTIYYILQK